MYNDFDNEHDWRYYNKLINVDNYYEYYRDFDDFVHEYKLKEKKKIIDTKIDEINKMVKYIRRNEYYVTNQLYYSWIKDFEEYEKEIELSGVNIDNKVLEKYSAEFVPLISANVIMKNVKNLISNEEMIYFEKIYFLFPDINFLKSKDLLLLSKNIFQNYKYIHN